MTQESVDSTGQMGGANFWGNYATPGIPFFTATTVPAGGVGIVRFPFVTQFLEVRAPGAELRCGVTLAGVTSSNYFTVPTSGTRGPFNLRTGWLYVQAPSGSTYEIVAGLSTFKNSGSRTFRFSHQFMKGT